MHIYIYIYITIYKCNQEWVQQWVGAQSLHTRGDDATTGVRGSATRLSYGRDDRNRWLMLAGKGTSDKDDGIGVDILYRTKG